MTILWYHCLSYETNDSIMVPMTLFLLRYQCQLIELPMIFLCHHSQITLLRYKRISCGTHKLLWYQLLSFGSNDCLMVNTWLSCGSNDSVMVPMTGLWCKIFLWHPQNWPIAKSFWGTIHWELLIQRCSQIRDLFSNSGTNQRGTIFGEHFNRETSIRERIK